MNSLAIHALPAIRILPRLPQMIAVAVAVAYLILPIAPVVPIPTVSGVAHADSVRDNLNECLGQISSDVATEFRAWASAMESGSGYRSPPVSFRGKCDATLEDACYVGVIGGMAAIPGGGGWLARFALGLVGWSVSDWACDWISK